MSQRLKLTGMSKSQQIAALFVVIDRLCYGPRSETDCLAYCREVARNGDVSYESPFSLSSSRLRVAMEEGGSSVFVKPLGPTPETLASAPGLLLAVCCGLTVVPYTELIKRLCILTMTLLPLEVDPDSINDPTSRVITPKVIIAYIQAAGDLVEAVCSPSPRQCVDILSPVNCAVSCPIASFVPVVTS